MLLIASGVFFVVILLLASPYLIPVDSYRPHLEKFLSDSLKTEVTIDAVRFTPIRGFSFLLVGLHVKDPILSDRSVLIIPTTRIRISLISLFSDTVVIRNIECIAPAFQIIEFPNGKLNTERLFSREKNGRYSISPVIFTNIIKSDFFDKRSFSIVKIAIKNGSITYLKSDPAREEAVKALIGSIDAEVSFPARGGLTMNAGGINIATDVPFSLMGASRDGFVSSVSYSNAVVSIFFDRGSCAIDDARFSSFGGDCVFHGIGVKKSGGWFGDVTFSITNVKSELLINSFSDEKDLVTGIFAATGTIYIPLIPFGNAKGEISGGGEMTISGGKITDFNLRKELGKTLGIPYLILPSTLETENFDYMSGTYKITSQKIFIEDFIVSSPIYDSTVKGYIGFDKSIGFSGEIMFKQAITDTWVFSLLNRYSGQPLTSVPFFVFGSLDNIEFKIPMQTIPGSLLDILVNSQ